MKVIKDKSITMNDQPLKVTELLKFLGVHIDNHLFIKLRVKHIEREFLISRMRMTRISSILLHF